MTSQPHFHDILCERGYGVQYHAGNIFYRDLVEMYRNEYVVAPKSKKRHYCKLIFDQLKNRNPPSRFLKQNKKTKIWEELEYNEVIKKIAQALRENAPKLREKILDKKLDSKGKNESEKEISPVSQNEVKPMNNINEIIGNNQNVTFSLELISAESFGTFSVSSKSEQYSNDKKLEFNSSDLSQISDRSISTFSCSSYHSLHKKPKDTNENNLNASHLTRYGRVKAYLAEKTLGFVRNSYSKPVEHVFDATFEHQVSNISLLSDPGENVYSETEE